LAYILPPILCVYIHSNFSGRLHETIFSTVERFSRSRSSKVTLDDLERLKRSTVEKILVTDCSSSRKRVCISLLVQHNLGPI